MTELKNIIDKYKDKYDFIVIEYYQMCPIPVKGKHVWETIFTGVCRYDEKGLRPLDADVYELNDLGEEGEFSREMTNEELYEYNRDLKESYKKGFFVDFIYDPRKDDGLL